MASLDELEMRIRRVEHRWEESDSEFYEAMLHVVHFQQRVARSTSAAVAIAGSVLLLFAIKHWFDLGGWWPQAFSLAIGILIYAVLSAWLDRWRMKAREHWVPSSTPVPALAKSN